MARAITVAAINKVLRNNEISYRGKRFVKCTSEVPAVAAKTSLEFIKAKTSGRIYTPCWDYTIYCVEGIYRMVIKGQMFNIES